MNRKSLVIGLALICVIILGSSPVPAAKDRRGEPTATLLVTGLEELQGSAIGPGGALFVTAPLTGIAGVLALTISAAGSAALASRDKSVFVSGNSTFSDCGLAGSDYAILLTGDLKGCLSTFVQDFKCKELEHYDLYQEEGREVFVGKFRGKQGRFRTTYTFDAAYAKGFCQSFDASQEVGGGCNHKINGGSGVFEDAEGLIKFIDVNANVTGDPVTGEFNAGTGGNNFLYYGRIDFDHDD